MNSKRFFILTNGAGTLKLSVHLKMVEIGGIAVVDIFGAPNGAAYEILLTDYSGENVYERIVDVPCTISLGKNFNICKDVMVDLFSGGKAIISATIHEAEKGNDKLDKLREVEQYDVNKNNIDSEDALKKEAAEMIKRAKKLYSINETKEDSRGNAKYFMDKIKCDFDELFDYGERDYRLSNAFKGSEWSMVKFDHEKYFLGKLYNKDGEQTHIAVAIMRTEKEEDDKSLGSEASFLKASIYDDSGYQVLVQDIKTGKAISAEPRT